MIDREKREFFFNGMSMTIIRIRYVVVEGIIIVISVYLIIRYVITTYRYKNDSLLYRNEYERISSLYKVL